jgi:autotransporter-associated beta strand protein
MAQRKQTLMTSVLRSLVIAVLLVIPAGAQLTWSLASGNESWPADKRTAIINAMTAAVNLYNANGYFPKTLQANYNASVPTAQASSSGWIDFGGSISTRVALHEISHTLGVGTVAAWNSKRSGNTWTGSFAINRVKLFDGSAATLSADAAHFWPYGLNYDTEDGTTNRIRHIKVVSALRRDMDIVKDSDTDGIPDDWEMFHFGNLAASATSDADGDGLNNLAEYNADGNPTEFTTTWTGATSSEWSTAANWTPGVLASNGTYLARLNVNNAANHPLIYDTSRGTTILRPADRGLVIGSGSLGNGAMSITGGSFSTVGAASPDVIGNSGNSASLTIDGGSFASTELQLGVNGQGSGSFTMNGGSATVTTFTFTFGSGGSGVLNLNGGTLISSAISRTGTGSGVLRFDGGTLRAGANSSSFLQGLSSAFIRSNGATIDTSTRSITIAQALLNDPAFPGGGLTKSGTGILNLTGTNTFTGTTAINAGILVPENPDSLSSSALVAADATLALTGGVTYQKTATLTLTGTGEKAATAPTPAVQRGALQSISGHNRWNGDITIASTRTRIGVQDGAALTLAGAIGESAGSTALIFRAGLNAGDDIIVTNSANSWSGATIVFSSSASGGALKLGATNALPIASPLLLAGNSVQGRLDLNGFNQTIGGLSNDSGGSSPVGSGIITNTGGAASTLTIAPTTNRTFMGVIQDGSQPIHVVKSGAANQIFTSAQAYTGDTTVTGGTLRIDQPYLADSSAVSIGVGAKLNLNFSGADSIAALTLGDIPMPPGIYNSTTHAAYFQGSGGLIVPGNFTNWLNLFPGLPADQRSSLGDFDNDGIENLLEYVLNGSPIGADTTILPTISPGPTHFVFTFTRREASAADTTQIFQYGSDLSGWTNLNITAPVASEVTLSPPSAGLQRVTISIPKSLATGGGIFGRLRVQQKP